MNESTLATMFSSATDMHATPQDFYDALDREFGFVLDVCATAENAKCPVYFSLAEGVDGLTRDWAGLALAAMGTIGAVWMNPPYGDPEFPCKPRCTKKKCRPCDPGATKCQARKCGHRGHCIDVYVPGIVDWVKKAYRESLLGVTVVCLLPARTDTRWWHEYVMWGEVRFVRGRLKFGDAKNSAPFPSAVCVFRPPPPPKVYCPCGEDMCSGPEPEEASTGEYEAQCIGTVAHPEAFCPACDSARR